ncbi:hypothetical protein KI387_007336, partial [Taxus chinensis]
VMKYWILREFDTTLIITVNEFRLHFLTCQLCSQLANPEGFTTSSADCHCIIGNYNKELANRIGKAHWPKKANEVVPKRWRVDIGFNQDAVLMLSAMNLPDGIQRRRTAVDELNMRSIFEENDVICAEVRGFQFDGSLHLQARSDKYGKLENGQLLTASAYLVKRRKQHFHFLEQYGVDMILGCNGFIWVGTHTHLQDTSRQGEEPDGSGQKESLSKKSVIQNSVDADDGRKVREHICRLANAIRVLCSLGFSISIELILETFEASVTWNVDIKDMLAAEFYVRIAEKEAERRSLRPYV